MVPAMSNKEGGPPHPKGIGEAPPDHPKVAPENAERGRTMNPREARLAAALRDNLRRRKASRRPAQDAANAED